MRLSLEDIFLSLTTEDQERGASVPPDVADSAAAGNEQEAANA
jgi:hypothetical protein